MTKRKLFFAIVFIMHIIGLLLMVYFYSADGLDTKTEQAIADKTPIDKASMSRLTANVDNYWQAEQQGKWAVCYRLFSAERINKLKQKKPQIFKDEESFVTERTRTSKMHPIEQVKILEIKYADDGLSALVSVGIKIKPKGKTHIKTLVKQHWVYHRTENVWLIGLDE